MAEMLKVQYLSVASKPKKESEVEDSNYFFFFTSPSPLSSSSSTEPGAAVFQPGDCEDCDAGRVHFCQEDIEIEQTSDRVGAARCQAWRDLIASHIQGIENEASELSSPGEAPSPQIQEERPTTRDWMTCDWEDLSEAIDSIAGGSSPGPDGIPAILLKKAKKPISRILCKLMKKTL